MASPLKVAHIDPENESEPVIRRFKIPLQSEIQAFMKQKKGWPDAFCIYYAEIFWNNYKSSGWKLSNGNAMKDWKAAFNSQWQNLKFKEHIEMFTRLTVKDIKKVEAPDESKPVLHRIDEFLLKYKRSPTSIKFEEFEQWYEFIKSEKLWPPFTKGAIAQLQTIYNNDNSKCRCAIVQITMDNYFNNNFTFSKVFELRDKLEKK